MKSYFVKTFGCKANLYDSQLIEAELQKRGWSPCSNSNGEGALLCVINSCTVTDEADRQTRKMAARLSRDNPQARVVVTGCAAEVEPERLTQSRGIHYVIGNRDKPQLVDLILRKLEQGETAAPESGEVLGSAKSYSEILSRHPMDREWPGATDSFVTPPVHLEGHSDKTRAFLKIQEGCNSFCTYCIIPYGRGPSRSLRPREVLAQVHALVAEGVREIVITGTNVGDYGTDWGEGPMLAELFKMIFSETALERLRVSSLDPTEITPEIFKLMESEKRFCPHFHVSLQSPHSRILRLMKRRYGFEQVKECLERIAALPAPIGGVFVGMDLITGFPGETEEEFEWGYQALEALPWSRLHVFPYSEREGTPATRLPGTVRHEDRIRRTKALNQLSMDRLTSHYRKALELSRASAQPIENVLLEKTPSRGADAQWTPGYAPNYLRVLIPQLQTGSRNRAVAVEPLELMVDAQGGEVALVSRLLEGDCLSY